MTAYDSVSTVYNCMLKGAADFLVKPVRKNELKNLWQHVWRRQASSSGRPEPSSGAQIKVKATDGNNDTSNHSSGYEACIQRNCECIERGSDAQSSCTGQDLEAEGAYLEHRQDLTQQKRRKSLARDEKIQMGEECVNGSEPVLMHVGEAQGFDNTDVQVNSFKDALDLIGAFNNYQQCSYISSGSKYDKNKVDSSTLLDLSLGRSHPSGSVNQVVDDKQSDASGFSWYTSRTSSICNQQSGFETNSDEQLSHQAHDYKSDMRSPTTVSQDEIQFPCSQKGVYPVKVPVSIHDGNNHRSIQRQAALTKFRVKRKDRCYRKK